MALVLEHQLNRMVWRARLGHGGPHTGFVQQIERDLLQDARADAAQHIVAALAFHDDVVNAGFVQQGPQQQARWASAHNDHLGAHSVCHAKLSSKKWFINGQ